MQKIDIKKMNLQDLEILTPVLSKDFDDFWTIQNLKSELENPNSYCFIAKLEDEIVGFIAIWKVIDQVHLNDIVIKKTYRNQGIGTILLEYVINICKLMERY